MTPDFLTHWTTFFSTTAEAAASLAGLVIVAVSVNVRRILEHKSLPARAAATIAALVLVLASSIAGLFPGQSVTTFGWECAAMAAPVWLLQVWAAVMASHAHRTFKNSGIKTVIGAATGQLQVLPILIGSGLLIANHGYGLRLLAAGAISTFIFAVFNTWVLLIEILR